MTDRMGKYWVIGKLGQGGMARVLLTSVTGPHGFQKLLVLKELKEELSQDHEFLSMFLDEARLAARLNHPNVVQTFEVGEEAGRHIIVMEYLEGQPLHNLFRRLGRAKISVEVHMRILADVLAGLGHAHSARDYDGTPLGVVHRDMSPQNVFVTYDGQVKILDFGIAKVRGSSTVTEKGVFKGKLSYVAPEQARGDSSDARSDLFAVGVMMWEALAGHRMMQQDGEAAAMARRISGNDPKIRAIAPETPTLLADICDKAMALDPGARFQSARAFQDALEDFLDRAPHRAGPKEVSLLVSSAFAEERRSVRELVEQQMSQQRALLPHNATPMVELAAPATSDSTTPSGPRLETNETPAAAPLVQSPAASRKSAWLGVLVAGGVVAAAAVIAVLVTLKRKEVAVPRSADQAAATPGTLTSSPSRVTISIAFGPVGARARLDGLWLEQNPHRIEVPADDRVHELEVLLDGYASQKHSLVFDRDIAMFIELAGNSPLLAVSTAPSSEPPGSASADPGERVRAPSAPKPSPTPGTHLEPPAVPTSKPKYEIDENDPYKKVPPRKPYDP